MSFPGKAFPVLSGDKKFRIIYDAKLMPLSVGGNT